MEKIIYLGLGGALGSVGRYLVTVALIKYSGKSFYLATLTVNIAGSFFIGLLASLFLREAFFHPGFRLFFMTGLLGGFTTFSSYILETMMLIQTGRSGEAAIYVVISTAVGLACAALGWTLSAFIPD